MAHLGIAENSGEIFCAAFSGDKCYRLSDLLGKNEDQIISDFWELGMYGGRTIEDAIKGGQTEGLTEFRHRIPVPSIHTIRDFYAFEEHVKAGRRMRNLDMIPEWYEIPVFYYSGISSLYASGDDVPYPSYTGALDFELELAFIIGKRGKDIDRKSALDYVFGITIANDWSARDVQLKEMKMNLGPAKSKDFATSIGPVVMSRDSLLDRQDEEGKFDIHVEGFVNGKKYSDANLKSIYHNIDVMIERASTGTMLYPGDVIMTGTVGTGCIVELGYEKYGWIQRNDIVEFTGEGIGKLINQVK